jgi:hypothetical protein
LLKSGDFHAQLDTVIHTRFAFWAIAILKIVPAMIFPLRSPPS